MKLCETCQKKKLCADLGREYEPNCWRYTRKYRNKTAYNSTAARRKWERRQAARGRRKERLGTPENGWCRWTIANCT